MKQWILVGIVTASLMVGAGAAGAQGSGSQSGTGGRPGAFQPPQPTSTAPGEAEANVPDGELALGSVRIPRSVMADGKQLAAGTYQVRLTPQEAKPEAAGITEKLERWVEFLRGKNVAGREVVSIVNQKEIDSVAEDAMPRPGGSKVEMLKGNEYIRVWINRGGVHYLIHLVANPGAKAD